MHSSSLLPPPTQLTVRNAILVGHSAGAMIGPLAAVQAPQHFAKAVLLAAWPGYATSVGEELTSYFCQADSAIAWQLARIAYLADSRAAIPQLHLPTLLLHCSNDVAVPPEVAQYLLTHLPRAQLVRLATTGHCPHLSAPLEALAAMQSSLTAA